MSGYDAIVVGSGFGGSVMALRLAEKGLKVLVLERGRDWKPEEYPRKPGDPWLFNPASPVKNNGWLELCLFDDMMVAQGAGVGGGSLVYANVSVEAPAEIFDRGWPQEITFQGLGPFYQRVGEMLDLQELPDGQLTERFRVMKEGAEALGHGDRFRKLPLAVSFDQDWSYDLEDPFTARHSKPFTNRFGKKQGTCVHCGNCDIGCQFQAKNTLDLNYLAAAETHGTEIRALHQVTKLEPENGGYRVHFDRIDAPAGRLVPGNEWAPRVVLAAGSIGSTSLLLRCRDQFKTLPEISPFLGHGWSSNGDFLTPAFYDRKIGPTEGPTITAAIDLLDGSAGGGEGFFIEDGGFPPVLNSLLESLLKTGRGHPRFGGASKAILKRLKNRLKDRRPLENVMPWFAQGLDRADGRLALKRTWWQPWKKQVRLDWKIKASKPMFDALIETHKALSEATGGRPWVPPSWTWFANLATPHPLGGCNMGPDTARGVVDHRCRVYGYDNLWVTDGAVVPEAIGRNPSRTIAALAERAADLAQV